MSVRVMGAVWDSALPHNLKFVLLSYADHADHLGADIWPSIPTTARKTGFSERAVQKLTRQLNDLGILIDDGTHTNNVRRWRIDMQRLADYTPGGEQNSPPPPPPAPTSPPSGENHAPQAVNATPPSGEHRSPKPTTDPSTTDPSIDDDDGQQLTSDRRSSPSQKKRTRAHATRRPTTPAPRHPQPLPDYPTAIRHPAVLDHALLHAGLLNANTRRSILQANPNLTVEQIFAWNAYRVAANATSARHTDPGALVALLSTGAKPPRNRLDPATVETWLLDAGYLLDDDQTPNPSGPPPPPTPPPATPLPQPDPAAHTLWQTLLSELSLSLQRPVFDNWLRDTTGLTLTDDTLTVCVPTPFAQEWLQQRMNGMIKLRLQRIAQKNLFVHYQLPAEFAP